MKKRGLNIVFRGCNKIDFLSEHRMSHPNNVKEKWLIHFHSLGFDFDSETVLL